MLVIICSLAARLRLPGVLLALCLTGLSAHAQRIIFEGIQDYGYGWSRSWVDVNNDGKDDYCVLAGGDAQYLDCYYSTYPVGTFSPRTRYSVGASGEPIRWADVNGDGQVDFCKIVGGNYPGEGSVQCRLGPNFSAVVSASLPLYSHTCILFDDCTDTEGMHDNKDFFLVDVNSDGRADACYVYATLYYTDYSLRCMIATGSGFNAPTSAWIRPLSPLGHMDWPRGFHDVNGDGFPDFCRINSGTVHCLLGSENGIESTATMDTALGGTNHKEGAAFVDINGDGKTDFCRFTGPSNGHAMTCRLSSGKAWLTADAPGAGMSNAHVGHATARWWADVNGDGLPDFCRAVGPNPNTGSNVSNLWCRLARGGDTTTGLFAPHDLQLDANESAGAVQFGVTSGGRAFCDAFGTGIQTLCRATYRTEAGAQECYEGVDGPICYTPTVATNGIAVGVYGGFDSAQQSPQKDEVQGTPALLSSYTDGLGAETRVTYMPLSSQQVYAKSGLGTAFPRVQIVHPRSPVVFETRAWRTGTTTTLTGNARYFYKDLRVDNESGSRGFRERWFLSEGANTIEHALFYQGLGSGVDAGSLDASTNVRGLLEVGQVREKKVYAIDPSRINPDSISGWTPPPGANPRQKQLAATMRQATTLAGVMSTTPVSPTSTTSPFMLLKRTVNTLGETVPQNPRHRPVDNSVTTAWDWTTNGPVPVVALPTVTATTVTSNYGNVTSLTETTALDGQTWSKSTTNEYNADNPSTWILGRLTRATTTSNAPSAAAQLAAHPSSYGSSPNANATSSASPTVVTLVAPAPPNTQVGQSSTVTATLTNTTSSPLMVVRPTASAVTGTGLSFASTTCGMQGVQVVQLAAGANCTVTATFAPTTATTVTGTVAVETAAGPRVASFSATSLATYTAATLTSAAPNLGNTWWGMTPPTATVSFRNDGNTAMSLSELSGLSAPFQLSGNNCSGVAPGASCSMTITMSTSAAGSGPNTVSTVGATNNPSFAINGSVSSAVSRWSTTSLSFGSVYTGQSSTQNVTLHNDGFGTSINWTTALANLPAGFSANVSACGSVAAGGSCTVAITFSPTAAQVYSGGNIYPSNRSYSNNTLSVSGTGAPPLTTLNTSPASLAFGTMPKDSIKTLSLALTNAGTVPLSNIGYAISFTSGTISIGYYSTMPGTCPASGGTLAAGASCTMSVSYEAFCSAGSRNGVLTISSPNLSPARAVTLTASTANGTCY